MLGRAGWSPRGNGVRRQEEGPAALAEHMATIPEGQQALGCCRYPHSVFHHGVNQSGRAA